MAASGPLMARIAFYVRDTTARVAGEAPCVCTCASAERRVVCRERHTLACGRRTLSRERRTLPCDRCRLPCDRCTLSCARRTLSCARRTLSCARRALFCERPALSMVRRAGRRAAPRAFRERSLGTVAVPAMSFEAGTRWLAWTAAACDSMRAPFIGRFLSIVRVIMPCERRALAGAWASCPQDMPLRLRMRR
jgi:hypothetical protein